MTLPRPAAGAVALFAALWSGVCRADEPYRLAEGDEVRLVAPGAPDFSGVYLLGERGGVALPLTTPVNLEGLTLPEAATALREALSAAMVRPELGLELTRRRPFFITGDVAQAGMYPTQAGLTLAQAVAVAGGGRRAAVSDLQTAVTAIRAGEELDVAVRSLGESRLRLARLEAEIADAADFTPDPALFAQSSQAGAQGDLALVAAREREIFLASSAAYQERLAALSRQRETRDAEIAALEGRRTATERLGAQLAGEMKEVRDLLARGLAPTMRLNALTREADRQQSDLLQIGVMLNQARQGRNQIDLEIANSPRERRVALLERALETRARIDALRRQVEASAALTVESGGAARTGAGAALRTVFRVTRRGAATAEETADGGLPVRPGDLIEVRRILAAPWAAE